MALKILHTADVHLGLTFGDYPEAIKQKLVEARFETLESLVVTANEQKCDLLVVAGDLFDNTRQPKKTVIRAAKILSGFEGVTLVLPGNHDYITHQPDELWAVFQEAKSDRVRILGEKKTYRLQEYGVNACIYAAPCYTRHSKEHSVGWIARADKDPESRFHIGLAHGSFEGLTPDLEGDYYPMKASDLLDCGLDIWLMGHIHKQYPERWSATDRIFYPATPEPDGYDCRHEGRAWLIEMSDRKEVVAKSLVTGRYRFCHHEVAVHSLVDLEKVRGQFLSVPRSNWLVKLKITGSLVRDEKARLGSELQAYGDHFLQFLLDPSEVTVQITPEDIQREFGQESFAHRLLQELARSQEDAEALQFAYDLIKEVSPQAVRE